MLALYFAPHNQAKPLLNCNTHHDAFAMLCITTACLNSPMPLRLNALLCQCSATPLVYYSVPKPSAPLLCPSSAYLRLALAPFFFSMPLLCISSHCPHIPLLCQNHAPLSHGNTLPRPFITIRCPCATRPCFAISIPNKAITSHR